MKKRLIAITTLLSVFLTAMPVYAYSPNVPPTFTTELYAKSGPTYTAPKQPENKSIAVTKNAVSVYVNGQAVPADNFVYDGTTYLPIRAVGDSFGANIDYNSATKTANITIQSSSEPVKDIEMSNYLIASLYASDMVKYMFLIKDSVDVLPNMYTLDAANDLRSDIKNLRADIDLVYQCDMSLLYDIAIYANNVATNAESCLELVEKSSSTPNFEKDYGTYHSNVAFCALSSLDKLDKLNTEALDYALSK